VLALEAGYAVTDIDGLADALECSRRSVYRWLSELEEAKVLTPAPVEETTANSVTETSTVVESLAREAQALADQVRDLRDDLASDVSHGVTEVAQTVPNLAQPSPLSPHTPLTPENLTSPPPISPPRRRGRSKPDEQEMAMVAAIVEECNRLWGKRFSPQAHADYIARRIRRFPDVTLDEHIAIVQRASANPWWRGEPSPRVIYSRDDLFDAMRQERTNTGRKMSDREQRQREMLGDDIFTQIEGASRGRNAEISRPDRIALAGNSIDQR
jgi:AcrR family transcriptional regulator